ncbi:hypothetical protein [Leifsonia virtsii]|uniref:Uncharacterized protein n=1 Tax=Leifsonia virtsii TaxID=3035915 RepID=A0ABT8J095_9MICO|nr:hypothetical protein [Leifsonia virtsii]MDN4598485.1 hypothetical protein [Leifsonia virtsii]
MAMTDIRTPIPAPDFAPAVIVASCDSCSFDGEVTASVVEDERTWSASAVTYEFECPEGHLNRMRVEDGDDS